MNRVKLLFNILLCVKLCLSISNTNNVKMIVDVITSFEQPTALVANVCWKSTYKLKLATMLTKEKSISMQYLRTTTKIDRNMISNNYLLFLMDLQCASSKSFINQANVNNLFSKNYRWLILAKTNDTMQEFMHLNILVDSEFIVAEEQEDRSFLLHAIYKIQPKSDWIKEYYGTWTNKNSFNKSGDRIISNAMRRKNLQHNPVTTSLIATDNSTKKDYSDLSSSFFIDSPTKSTYSTLTNLYDFINATRAVIFSETWGYLINGTWTGMIGDVDSGRAELCGCNTFMTEERTYILQYMTVTTGIPMPKIVFRQPPLSYQNNLFILPFSTSVWYCLGGFVIILVIILYINAKWDIKKYEDYNEKTINETCLKAIWGDIIIFVISAISQQGSSHELKGTLGRLVMFIIFLAFVFFYTSYSANIIVLLQSTSDQIRTVSDLTNSKLELGIEDVIYNKYYFTADYARDPVRKAFYEAKIAPKGAKPNFMNAEEGVKKIQTKPFAFNMNVGLGYRIISKYFQEHEKCGLVEIDYIQASKPWLCSKKSSPYNEMYRVGLYRIEEHGLSDRNNRLLFAKKPICSTAGGNFGSVNMVDFYPVLLLLLFGMILAFALLVLEILVYRRQKMREISNRH